MVQENHNQQMHEGEKGFAHLLCLRGNKTRLWRGGVLSSPKCLFQGANAAFEAAGKRAPLLAGRESSSRVWGMGNLMGMRASGLRGLEIERPLMQLKGAR